ncbi:TRAP transporter small permease [Albidovulum sediminicola]|uniref:TRAP transporter small permease protein n=1 Tax=Albidovulum sediminicola TaxID=2984331 RepID=A0ABT2Z167_9RHOB|nr:TRAP transporter small permease [Defluviimonas sp. WL0075]MCV2864866.1 TRAP transporter small permease [Defluviimonas sp. WL0075]
MKRLATIFARLTEGVAALMMAAMFATFLIQIAVRYVAGSEWFIARLGHLVDPVHFGWTLEFCLVMWLWIVFWGNAFVVRDRDHVTFDILYLWVRPGVRKWLAVIGAAIIAAALLLSIGPTWDKLRILRLKSSATLPVKMLPIYSIYFVFLAAVGLRYLWRVVAVLRHGATDESHHLPQGGVE